MSAEVTVGLFTLGGVLLTGASSVGRGWVDRRAAGDERADALEGERRAAAREDAIRWLEDRRAAHTAFLTAAKEVAYCNDHALAIAQGYPFEPLDDSRMDAAENALSDALAALELVAGDKSSEAAGEWEDALVDAEMHHVANRLRQRDGEPLELTEWAAESQRAKAARTAYVEAARKDLLTSTS